MSSVRNRRAATVEACSQLTVDLLNSFKNTPPLQRSAPAKRLARSTDIGPLSRMASPTGSLSPVPERGRNLRRLPAVNYSLKAYEKRMTRRVRIASQQSFALSDESSGKQSADENGAMAWRFPKKRRVARADYAEQETTKSIADTPHEAMDGPNIDGSDSTTAPPPALEASLRNSPADWDISPCTKDPMQVALCHNDVEKYSESLDDLEDDCWFTRDYCFFRAASRVFEQEDNWSNLVREAEAMRNDAEKRKIGVNNHSTILLLASILEAKSIYSLSTGVRHDNVDDAEVTDKEAAILHTISNRLITLLSPGRLDILQREAAPKFQTLVEEIHGHVFPAGVGLLQSCLMAHFLNSSFSRKGINQVLLILRGFSDMCTIIDPSNYSAVRFPDRLAVARVLFRFLAYVFEEQKSRKGVGTMLQY
ncbi:hypothetical protein LOZ61_003154 [Ophidiomyces ophidiicola]|nr:hypothetical protein LOZ61_003154 [Ophidiomyces ophidiicola]KAI1928209.1 hypothetical protein LOZ60_002523 [Ophidiomyces ophidiicola]KAI1973172.1 hypothetical protein LOZ56_002001 [Ophidiomyces ophidiicola]KAI2008585.1 hypothetical protein LOZ49_004226 [Ophidiomyces ophidiicola]KAI2027345.1 hypothetical protein LOZ45_002707 [Ophidiomyces ophidiicola]